MKGTDTKMAFVLFFFVNGCLTADPNIVVILSSVFNIFITPAVTPLNFVGISPVVFARVLVGATMLAETNFVILGDSGISFVAATPSLNLTGTCLNFPICLVKTIGAIPKTFLPF